MNKYGQEETIYTHASYYIQVVNKNSDTKSEAYLLRMQKRKQELYL